jgi:hypothetical protein
VPLYKNEDDFRVFCGMMNGLAFLPVPDLTNGIHLVLTRSHLFGRNAYTAVPATSLNGTRMVYSYLNGCGATEKIPSMKMKKVWGSVV